MSAVINLAEVRASRQAARASVSAAEAPVWQNDIATCCAHARVIRGEHSLEYERLHFERLRDGLPEAWWDCPDDHQQRVRENQLLWDRYVALLLHIAEIPARTRREASEKRHTIGRQWLKADTPCKGRFGPMREGCIRDDHLFPPSLRMIQAPGKTL